MKKTTQPHEAKEKKEIPYFAIGNDELRDKKPVGVTVLHKVCGKRHEVEYGETVNSDGTKTPSKLLGFVHCGKKSYLVAVEGKEI